MRSSNFELLRILAMLGIVASHGIMYIFSPVFDTTTPICDFLVIQGIWGKIGINCFMLISGYFMCMMDFSIKKFIKLLTQIITVSILTKTALLLLGEDLQLSTFKDLLGFLFPWRVLTMDHFVASFLIFYLFSPYVILLIRNLSQKMHLRLIVLSLFVYVGYETIPGFVVLLDPVVWFSILYLIAAYIRKYSFKYSDSVLFWLWLMLLTTITAVASVVVGKHTGLWGAYKFSGGANSVFSLAVAFSSFMFFKNWNIGYNKYINLFGAATFGVLLIHTCCSQMKHFLFVDIFRTTELLDKSLIAGVILYGTMVVAIFLLCAILDIARKKWLEPISLKYIYKIFKIE